MGTPNRDARGRSTLSIKPMDFAFEGRIISSASGTFTVGIMDVVVATPTNRRYTVTLLRRDRNSAQPQGELVYDVGVRSFLEAYRAYSLLRHYLSNCPTPLVDGEMLDYVRASHLAVTGGEEDRRARAAIRRLRLVVDPGPYRQIMRLHVTDVPRSIMDDIPRSRY